MASLHQIHCGDVSCKLFQRVRGSPTTSVMRADELPVSYVLTVPATNISGNLRKLPATKGFWRIIKTKMVIPVYLDHIKRLTIEGVSQWDAVPNTSPGYPQVKYWRNVSPSSNRSLCLWVLLYETNSQTPYISRVVDEAKCIVVTRVCVCVCLSVCLSVHGRMPILLHGPWCNVGE